MKIYTLITIAALSILTTAKAQQATPKTDTLFFEDFNEKALDRTKWNVEISGRVNNDEQEAYIDSTATAYLVKGADAEGAVNGALVIKGIYKPGFISTEHKKYDFISARLNTENKMEFTQGTASARMKMAGGAGIWPAFWTLGNGRWPECGEIDIMETIGDSSWQSNALHGPGNLPFVNRNTFPPGTDVTQWHIYSVERTANTIVFKLDGKITYSVTRAMVEQYGRWAFSDPEFIILNLALGGNYPAGENKTSAPYYGLPDATVNKIKAGAAKVMVDWVLVTKTGNQ